MRVRRQAIGLGFIGLFIVLLCTGSTWGSEAVSHELNEPAQSTTRGDTIDRFDASEGGIPVSFPLRSNTASDTFENPLELTYTDFSINSLDPQSEPVDWQTLSIIPELSDTAREILLDGIAKGNNPHAFSTIGDCQSFPSVFMGIFDDPGTYEFASDEGYLQEAIAHFTGSFARESETVDNGYNVASVLSPLWGGIPTIVNPMKTLSSVSSAFTAPLWSSSI